MADNADKFVWQIKISPSGAITLAIFSIVIVLFVFFCGMFIGRGQQSSISRQELTTIIPEESKSKTEVAEVIPAENLNFMQNLKNDAPVTEETKKAENAPAVAKALEEVKQQTTTPAPTAQTATKPTAKVEAVVVADNTIYDYVYQVAAFKEEAQADKLREKLEGLNMRTKLVKEKAKVGTWYKVQVLMRGTEAAALELKANLEQARIKDPMLVSRSAV